jgi:hypothetical protein
MLSDADLSRNRMSSAAKKLNFEVCVNSLNILRSYQSLDEEYFIFKDFQYNELVLFSKFKKLWVAKCYAINEIIIVNDSFKSFCSKYLKVKFQIKNESLVGFLDENLIIRDNSELVECKKINQLFKFDKKYMRRISLEHKRYKVDLFAHGTHLKLNSLNLSKLNFFHSNKITEKLDFLSEFKGMMFKDDYHFKTNMENIFSSTNSTSFLSLIANNFISLWDVVGFYFKIIFFVTIILLTTIAGVKLKIHKDLKKVALCLLRQCKTCGIFSFEILSDFLSKNKKKTKNLEVNISKNNNKTEILDLDIVSDPIIDNNRITESSL